MKKNRFLYLYDLEKSKLEKIIFQEIWSYDIPGFIIYQELVHVIRNEFILPQGSKLGFKATMDAENHYVQTGDMHDLNQLFRLI